jgi:SAM-dependent methyltransferase
MYRGTDRVGGRRPVGPSGLEAHSSFDVVEAQFHAALDESLKPRGPDSLFDVVEGLGLPPGSSVVDVGCGRGRQALELARRFGFNVTGIDPGNRHQRAEVEAACLSPGSVIFREGRAEAIPAPDSTVDLIFCRESLMYADLDVAVPEFSRVLRAGGRGLVYLVLTGPQITDAEAVELWAPLAPNSLRPYDIEQALARSGLSIDETIDYSSEWGEVAQEREGTAGRRLLYAARLLREPSRYISQFGKTNYDIMLGDCFWHVYRMIGKLTGYACTFTKT